jgi:hypothetical protein
MHRIRTLILLLFISSCFSFTRDIFQQFTYTDVETGSDSVNPVNPDFDYPIAQLVNTSILGTHTYPSHL